MLIIISFIIFERQVRFHVYIISLCPLVASCQSVWLYTTCLLIPLVSRSLVRTSFYVFFGLPANALSLTSNIQYSSFSHSYPFSIHEQTRAVFYPNHFTNMLVPKSVSQFLTWVISHSGIVYPPHHSHFSMLQPIKVIIFNIPS